jgi:hypothetical protein
MRLARAFNLAVVTSGVLLTASIVGGPAYARQISVNSLVTSADMAAVAGGTVTSASGAAMPGVAVDLYAWPSDAVLQAMKAGQLVPTTLLAATTTTKAGTYTLQVPTPKLQTAGVESGYANLEVFSPAGGTWFISYRANSLPAHPAAPVTVNLNPDIGVNCGTDDLGRPLSFTGFFKIKQLNKAWATVGQGYIVRQNNTAGDFMQFDYNKGATHSQTSGLGVGISGKGIDIKYNRSGTSASTADAEEDFPNETKNTLFQTEFNVGQFRGECHGRQGDNSVNQVKQKGYCPRRYVNDNFTYYVHKCFWLVRSTGWFGPSDKVLHPSSHPGTPGKFCGHQLKGSLAKTHNQEAVEWSSGFDIGVANGITGVSGDFSGSAQTGYDTDAKMVFTFKKTGWICGTNHDPNTAAQLVVRGNLPQ